MAASGMYPAPVTSSSSSPRLVALPQQKKVLEDVLECIIQLKAEFFDTHQPINDDNVCLQRLCAKLEHLIQMGMREKTSLLGRKKDYWDYFCDCLGSAKGSNEGIRYVKNLRENKTSLGRGRAFVRFCLVHQRLADALQQCLVHSDKTSLWFLPSSVLCNKKDANTLISALYDLNAMHFDLSPRGYDLDSDWPSFSNRKMNPGGSWHIPISRRSSITSMDTISQASISLATSPPDPFGGPSSLVKDVESGAPHQEQLLGALQKEKEEAQEQVGALTKEKEEAHQAAWETQGKMAALQEQLDASLSGHASLQERYRELDVSFVKLKLEKEHLDKLLSDERKMSEEGEARRVSQLQGEEEVWKREMREEGERRRKEIDKLQEEVRRKTEEEEEGRSRLEEYSHALATLMADCKMEAQPNQDIVSNIEMIRTSFVDLQTQLSSYHSKSTKTADDRDRLNKDLKRHEGETERLTKAVEDLNAHVLSLEMRLQEKCQECESLTAKGLVFEKSAEKHKEDASSLKDLNQELRDKEKTLKELNASLKDRVMLDCSKYLPGGGESVAEVVSCLEAVVDKDDRMLQLQQCMLGMEREIKRRRRGKEREEEEDDKIVEMMETFKSDMTAVFQDRQEKLGMLVSVLRATEDKSRKFQKEVEMLAHGGQVLNEQLSLSQARLELLSSKLEDEEIKMADLTSKHEATLQSLKAVGEGKEGVEREMEGLKSRVQELCSQLDSTSCDNAGLKTRLEQADGEKGKLGEELDRVQKEKVGLAEDLGRVQKERDNKHSDLCSEREKLAALARDSDGEKDSKADLLEQMARLQGEKEEERREKEEIVSRLEKEKEEVVEKANASQKDLQSLLSEMEAVRVAGVEGRNALEKHHSDRLEQMSQRLKQMVTQCEGCLKVKEVGGGLSESGSSCPNDGEHGDDDNNTSLKKMEDNDDDDGVESNLKSLGARLQELCEAHAKMEDVTKQRVSTVLEEEKDKLLSEVDAALEETHHIKSQLEQTSELLLTASSNTNSTAAAASNGLLDTVTMEKESLQSKLSSLEEEVSKQDLERDELQSKMAAMVEEIARHESEKDGMKRAMAALKSDCERAEDSVQEKLGEKRELETRLSETEERLTLVLEDKRELEQAAEGLHSQTEFSHKVLEESLTEAHAALEVLKADKMALEDKCRELDADNQNLQTQIDTLGHQGNDVTKDEDIASLRKALEEEKARYEMDVDTLQCEVSALQFQISSVFIEQQEELQAGYSTSKKQSREELQAEIQDLEEENEALRKCKDESLDETQRNEFVCKIQSLEATVRGQHKRMEEMKHTVETCEASKEDMSQELTRLQLSAKRRLEERDKELNVLRSDNQGMKKQLLKLIKDKDNLWQKTDALVDERKRQASDRWVDNSTVTLCGKCKAEFSLFLRKHHCRLCGKIFCWSCSDNWLDTAHSSKKARVCKTCFDQKTNPDASLMGTSLIDNDSDDNDDDDTDNGKNKEGQGSSSYMLTMDSKGNAEVRQVLPSGAVSQPLNKKDGDDVNDDDDDDDDDDCTNETDEGKLRQSSRRSPSIDTRKNGASSKHRHHHHHPHHQQQQQQAPHGHEYEMETDSLEDSIYNANAEIRVDVPSTVGDGAGGDDDDDAVDDSVYQVITQAEVAKTMSDYQTSATNLPAQTNMTSSMVLSADDLETGEVNRQNQVWISPGRLYGVPIKIGTTAHGAALSWEFSSHPKDIVFSIKFQPFPNGDNTTKGDNSSSTTTTTTTSTGSSPVVEEVVSPCKCDAHKQTHKGELTPKRPGVYTLVFDNTYSRLTTKQVHYLLKYRKCS